MVEVSLATRNLSREDTLTKIKTDYWHTGQHIVVDSKMDSSSDETFNEQNARSASTYKERRVC